MIDTPPLAHEARFADDPAACIRSHLAADGALHVKVTPGAAKDALSGGVDANGRAILLVRLRAKAVDGAANKALIAFLAKTLGVAKSHVIVEHGASARQKRLRVRL